MSTNGRKRVAQLSQPKLEFEKVQDVDWHFGDQVVRVNAAYTVPAIHPWREGPWLREADKILWRDAASGLECIIRRCEFGGALEGWVGITSEHPLYSFDEYAMIGLDISVHGRIGHTTQCQQLLPEHRAICRHVVRTSDEPWRLANLSSDNLWWFGFDHRQPGDIQPTRYGEQPRTSGSDGVVHYEYRTEAYVHRQCQRLAAQLDAIGAGREPAHAIVPDPTPPGLSFWDAEG